MVVFGRGGDTVYYSSHCTGTGYGTPENPHAAQDIPDGVPVVDIRPAVDTPEGFRWVIIGPLVDVDLPDGQVEKCPGITPAFLDSLEKPYKTMAILHGIHTHSRTRNGPGPLDKVGIKQYIQGWKRHGAKVGVYRDGVPVWEINKPCKD